MTRLRSPGWALLVALLISVSSAAQTPKPDATDAPAVPTITFVFDWPDAHPPHYSIALDSDGSALYTAVDEKEDSAEPYVLKFTASQAARERIFADAHALNYFQGQFDFTRHKIAFTGSKSLTYGDSKRHSQTTYNWSENAQLMALTDVFLGISNTLEAGRKLEYLRRFDRLGLNDELKEMEEQAKSHYLNEVHVIAPLLRQIADDPAIVDLARQRARRLLHLAAAEDASSAASQ